MILFNSPSRLGLWIPGQIKFGNVKHNSAALNAFTEVVKVMNHIELWYAELTWYSPNATHQICLHDLKPSFWIQTFRPTWPYLIVKVLATLVKFLLIWLLYCDKLCLLLSHNKCFLVEALKHIMKANRAIGLVLWHLNPCRLFNAKFCFYIHTYIYMLNIIHKHFDDNIFKWAWVHVFLHTVK